MHTDANAIAGLLEEIFARDVTAAERVCQSCRTRSQIGAHLLYTGSGLVMRCPACHDVAATIVTHPRGYAFSAHGTWLLGDRA